MITVPHVSAYTVVRATRQVNGGPSFSARWGFESPEPIQMKFGSFDYVHCPTPHAKYGGLRRRGWGGEMGDVVPSRVFFTFSVF